MSDVSDDPNVIRYDLNKTSPLMNPKLRWVSIAFFLLWLGLAIGRHAPWSVYIFPASLLIVSLVNAFRSHEIVVDREHVKGPFRKAVPWSAVDYVENPGRWGETVTLHLKDGTSRRIGLPLRYMEDVARIGNVPVGTDAHHGNG